MTRAQLVFLASAGLFVAMGLVHGGLTLGDLRGARSFAPVDEGVGRAMRGARVRFSPSLDLWRTWLGLHLTHSLGLLAFGSLTAAAALVHWPWVAESVPARAGALAIAFVYAAVAARYFFWAPALGCAAATTGFAFGGFLL